MITNIYLTFGNITFFMACCHMWVIICPPSPIQNYIASNIFVILLQGFNNLNRLISLVEIYFG